MISILKKAIPSSLIPGLFRRYWWLREHCNLILSCYSDYRRYRRYYSLDAGSKKTKGNIAAMILMEAHGLEKAFSLPDIRAGFGHGRIEKLNQLLQFYKNSGFSMDDLSVQKASSVLSEYLRFHDEIQHDLGEARPIIERWVDSECTVGGYLDYNKDYILKGSQGYFEDFALSRWSVRNYTPQPISNDLLLDAVRIARKTPSVCNRQPWKAYFVKSERLKKNVLNLQNGNRGFGDRAKCVIVVTSDMRNFVCAGERNESFVDGGMFAMSLLYALHYKGVGACPLNWMVLPKRDQQLRDLLEIPQSENIIMLIVIGHLPEHVRVAKSVRREPEQLAVFK